MKKVSFYLSIFLLFTFAHGYAEEYGQSFRTVQFDGDLNLLQAPACSPHTLYGQPTNLSSSLLAKNGLFGIDNFPAVGEVNQVSWWMSDLESHGNTFDIFFYENDGDAPANMIQEFLSVTVSREMDPPQNNLSMYKYTFDLPVPLSFPDGGWIGIRTLPTDLFYTMWASSSTGDGFSRIVASPGVFFTSNYDLAFCLTNVPPQPVPLAGWSLYVALGLMAGFIVWRLFM